jgi:hypothetical protein
VTIQRDEFEVEMGRKIVARPPVRVITHGDGLRGENGRKISRAPALVGHKGKDHRKKIVKGLNSSFNRSQQQIEQCGIRFGDAFYLWGKAKDPKNLVKNVRSSCATCAGTFSPVFPSGGSTKMH